MSQKIPYITKEKQNKLPKNILRLFICMMKRGSVTEPVW